MNDLEYQVIVNVYARDGSSTKHAVRSSDRDAAISKYNYLQDLIKRKQFSELKQWTDENLYLDGYVTSLEGLFGIAMIRIL